MSFLKLVAGVALGVWLGVMALLLSVPHLLPYLSPAAAHLANQWLPAPAVSQVGKDASNEMFQHYLQNQQQVQAQQNRQVEERDRQSSTPCQFWRQQYQADPTQKNRVQMDEHCG
ncbi:MAG: hypothetical protein GAK43_00898 [Stenotrophomonas maltophilia]|nr:MAG: hypothetical protein GAK43_00898 [Stenotrophomonas maltophilia]